MTAISSSTTTPVSGRAGLPLPALLALAAAGFVTMLTETVPAGLLPQVGHGLNVSPGQAGQLLTMYTLGSVVTAIPLTALTRAWPRRRLLLLSIAAVGAVNMLTAVSSSYELTAAVRLLAGAAAGVQWAMIAGYAMRLVDQRNRGRALAVSMAGVPLALAVGVPLGTVLGEIVGWRIAFASMAAAAVLVVGWVVRCLPALPGEQGSSQRPIRRVLTAPGLAVILFAAFAFELGHMNLYTYVTPFLTRMGLRGHIGEALFVFGAAAVLGLWTAGAVVDRHLRGAVFTVFAVLTACMFAFATITGAAPVTLIVLGSWGLALGAAPTVLQAAAARVAGSDSEVAQALLVTMLNAGMSAGGAIGGIVLAVSQVNSLPWTSFAVFVATLALVTLRGRSRSPSTSREQDQVEGNSRTWHASRPTPGSTS